MPRERLLHHGAGALSNAELIALLLRTGTRGENILQLSERLLREFNGLRGLGRASVGELQEVHGLGRAKAVCISASLELASRLLREQVSSTPLNSAEKVYDFLAPQLIRQQQECLLIICCDLRLRPQQTIEISRGSSRQTLAHIPEILKRVLKADCEEFFIAHNHPSGDPEPSQADRHFTRRLKSAADTLDLRLLDHVIVGSPGSAHCAYYSFAENHQLSQ